MQKEELHCWQRALACGFLRAFRCGKGSNSIFYTALSSNKCHQPAQSCDAFMGGRKFSQVITIGGVKHYQCPKCLNSAPACEVTQQWYADHRNCKVCRCHNLNEKKLPSLNCFFVYGLFSYLFNLIYRRLLLRKERHMAAHTSRAMGLPAMTPRQLPVRQQKLL